MLRGPAAKDALLGGLWEASASSQYKFALNRRSFSIRENSGMPLSIEYCGRTSMSDENIFQEGIMAAENQVYTSCTYQKPPPRL